MPPENMVISYPHMGSYAGIFRQLLRRLFPDAEVISPPPITAKTVELGAKHSPDFVCSPFKYNLGNYIEALEQGANVLLQTGLGCRYGYYGELQEQILRDLGYEFTFICLSRENARPHNILRIMRSELGCGLPTKKVLDAVLAAVCSIRVTDRFEFWLRENVGFETSPGALEKAHEKLLDELEAARSLKDVFTAEERCRRAVSAVGLKKPDKLLRVGMVGELYTLMEPHSNFFIEKQLAKEGISVSRVMSLWFLLFGKRRGWSVRNSGGYLNYRVGANGADSVAQSLAYSLRGYDGILHMKSFGCLPELNATPALQKLADERGIPLLQLSFDTHTGETGVQTRLEAFSDMLKMRKEALTKDDGSSGRGHRLGVHKGGRA